jgi:hypothetical protein
MSIQKTSALVPAYKIPLRNKTLLPLMKFCHYVASFTREKQKLSHCEFQCANSYISGWEGARNARRVTQIAAETSALDRQNALTPGPRPRKEAYGSECAINLVLLKISPFFGAPGA